MVNAGVVIEEVNLTAHILTSEIKRLVEDASLRETMKAGMKAFVKPDAATHIAKELLAIALAHES